MPKATLPESLTPSPLNTFVDHMVNTLSTAILDGSIPPGSRLVETELAQRFSVSRAPVRHALLRLESEGLITVRPYRGAVVRSLAGSDVIEVYVLRKSLGEVAIRKVIADNLVSSVAKDLIALEKIANSPATRKSQSKMIDADLAFQSGIVQACGLPRVIEQFAELTSEVRLFILSTKIVYPNQDEIIAAHSQLLQAILDEDIATATQLWSDRMRIAVQEFLELLPDGDQLISDHSWMWQQF